MLKFTKRGLLIGAATSAFANEVALGLTPMQRNVLLAGGNKVTGEVVIASPQISSGNSGKPNLLVWSQDATKTQVWGNVNSTVTANVATGPDGNANIGALVENTTNGQHYVSQTVLKAASSISYTHARIMKQGTRTRATLEITDAATATTNPTGGAYCVFDLAGGAVGVAATIFGPNFSAASQSMVSLGNGYYLCSITVTTSALTTVTAPTLSDAGSGNAAVANVYAGVNGAQAVLIGPGALFPTVAGADVLANLIDGISTTKWADYAYNAFAGVDAGVPVQWTGCQFQQCDGEAASVTSPASASQPISDYDYPARLGGTQQSYVPSAIKLSSDSALTANVVTAFTFTDATYYPRFDWYEVPISGTSRCASMYKPCGQLAGLQFVCRAQAGLVAAKPVAPTPSPWGGLYPAGSKLVTITSRTTSALVYYTKDGSTPSNTNGTLYSGPFTLTISGTVTLKLVAYEPRLNTKLSDVTTAIYSSSKIAPGQNLYDDRGILVEAHGGHLIEVASKSKIYWFGGNCNEYTSGFTGLGPRIDGGVHMYSCTNDTSSPDYLLNWKWEKQILPQPIVSGTPLASLTRNHVVFNANTNKFVLWGHGAQYAALGGGSYACIGESSGADPEGAWTWVNTSYDPGAGTGVGDCHLYANAANTTAYFTYVYGPGNTGIAIITLNSAFHAGVATTLVSTGNQEAPILVDNGTNLFLILGDAHGYANVGTSCNSRYIMASGLNPTAFAGVGLAGASSLWTAAGNYHDAQTTFMFKPAGKNQWVMGNDLWDFTPSTQLSDSRYAWAPVTVTATTLAAQQPASWNYGDLT